MWYFGKSAENRIKVIVRQANGSIEIVDMSPVVKAQKIVYRCRLWE